MRILQLARETIEMRRFGHEKEDVGEHTANLLSHLSEDKYFTFIFSIIFNILTLLYIKK